MDTVSQAPVILITGGSRGVGAATARLAAAQGYDVAISFVSNEAAARAVADDVEATGGRALTVRADSASPEQVSQLFAEIDREFGRIDVLVNNAAIIAQQSRIEDLEFERMQRIFAINSIGPILCARRAVKRMSHTMGAAASWSISRRLRHGSAVPMNMSTTPRRRAPSKLSRPALRKKSRAMASASAAFGRDTSTRRCMPAAESRDGWTASGTLSLWEEAASPKRWRARSCGWQVTRRPSSPARSSMSPAASERSGRVGTPSALIVAFSLNVQLSSEPSLESAITEVAWSMCSGPPFGGHVPAA